MATQRKPKAKTKPATIRCSVTGQESEAEPRADGTPALPRGWKRVGDAVYSPDAFADLFSVKAAKIPVASVVAGYEATGWTVERCREGRAKFRACLDASQVDAQHACDWFVRELAFTDRKPVKGFELPPWKASDAILRKLYQGARRHWPDLDSQSLAALRQRVVSKYRSERFAIRVLGQRSLPSFERKLPLPICAKDVKLEVNDQQKQVFLGLRVHGERFCLRLRGGRDFSNWHEHLKLAASTPGLLKEVLLSTRDGVTYATVVLAIRRAPRVAGKHTLLVRTDPAGFWVVEVRDRRKPWLLNADHMVRRVAEHRCWLQRVREDFKHWKTWPPEMVRQKRAAIAERCARHRRRVQDWIHKATAMLADYARRNQVGYCIYDDSLRSYLASFAWHQLRLCLKGKLAHLGIQWIGPSDDDDGTTITPTEE